MLFPFIITLLQHDCLLARGARQKKWKRICLLSRWSKAFCKCRDPLKEMKFDSHRPQQPQT